jgi:AbrB family looped-hinge helix DNA binding protein
MRSKITAKFQTTIPKKIREEMKLSINDSIEWKMENGKIFVESANKPFLYYRSSINVGAGDIEEDIEMAKKSIAEKNR